LHAVYALHVGERSGARAPLCTKLKGYGGFNDTCSEEAPEHRMNINQRTNLYGGGSVWKCPNCREEIVDALDLCWNCGVARSGLRIADSDREMQRAIGRQNLYVDSRQGLFFCVTSGILGGIILFFYRPAPPLIVKELIGHIKAAAETNSGINGIVSGLTKVPYCYILSGLLLFGFAGWIIDKIIGNGKSELCKISHLISCSDINKPAAKLIIVKDLPRKLVEDRLGFPLQIVTREQKELWVYKYIKITFENGKVSHIE
jgi:hypothetical protein